jgi:hypothetical protein
MTWRAGLLAAAGVIAVAIAGSWWAVLIATGVLVLVITADLVLGTSPVRVRVWRTATPRCGWVRRPTLGWWCPISAGAICGPPSGTPGHRRPVPATACGERPFRLGSTRSFSVQSPTRGWTSSLGPGTTRSRCTARTLRNLGLSVVQAPPDTFAPELADHYLALKKAGQL